jgi:replicative DNA helicase
MDQRLAGEHVGISTGFTLLDSALRGLKPGNLIYLAGRPGMGKTTLAMNVAEHVALSGHAVLFLSLEMGEGEIVDRTVASIGRIAMGDVLAGCPDQDDTERYSYALGRLADAPLILDEQGGLTLQEVRSKARSVKRKHGLDLLVIDYLQLMAGDGDNENAKLTAISAGLKGLAKELGIPVICLSQLNRELEKRTNRRPTMSDLRGSGSIEQDADLILFVYRDEVYNLESTDAGTAEIIIGKNRQGQAGMVRLAWNGRCTRFDNLADGWEPKEAYQPFAKKRRMRGFD